MKTIPTKQTEQQNSALAEIKIFCNQRNFRF